jgi:hypothetical protein
VAPIALTAILIERANRLPTFSLSNERENVMKITTSALAIALARPSKFAVAEGAMNLGGAVARPPRGVTIHASGAIATRPRNLSGNALAPIMHDPSGSTLTPSAMSRGG